MIAFDVMTIKHVQEIGTVLGSPLQALGAWVLPILVILPELASCPKTYAPIIKVFYLLKRYLRIEEIYNVII